MRLWQKNPDNVINIKVEMTNYLVSLWDKFKKQQMEKQIKKLNELVANKS